MSSFVSALRSYLLADETISDAAGGERIYCGAAPHDAVSPYVIVQQISGSARYGLSSLDGQDEDSRQIDVWATNYNTCDTLRLAIRARINGVNGVLFGDYRIHSVTEEDHRETVEPDGDGSETVWYRSSADYTIIRDSNET
jgi:hypothetical protein